MIDQLGLNQLVQRAKADLITKQRTARLSLVIILSAVAFFAGAGGLLYSLPSDTVNAMANTSSAILLLIIFSVIISAYMWMSRLTQKKKDATKSIIERTFPDSISQTVLYNRNGFFFFLMASLFVGSLIIWLVVPSDAPIPNYEVILIASPIWVMVCVSAKRLINRANHPDGHFYRPMTNEILNSLVSMGLFSLWLPSLAQLPLIAESDLVRNANTSPYIYLAFIFGAFFLGVSLFRNRHYRTAMQWLGAASYTAALTSIRKVTSQYPYSLNGLNIEGLILIFANQGEQAEVVLRHALPISIYRAALTPPIVTNLGYAIVRQKHYDEAIRVFSAAIEADSTEYAAYLGLVEVYLSQGIETTRAAKLLDLAELTIASRKQSDKSNWAAVLVYRAWIATLQKRSVNIDQLVQQALAEANPNFKPSFAILNYRIGQIMLLREDKAKAVHYFEQCHEIDPEGVYAQSSLDTIVALNNEH